MVADKRQDRAMGAMASPKGKSRPSSDTECGDDQACPSPGKQKSVRGLRCGSGVRRHGLDYQAAPIFLTVS